MLLPGPNSLYVMAAASRWGVRAGYQGAAGIFVGDTILMLLTVTGMASVLRATPEVFMAIKYAGAAYLAWVGLSLLRGALATWRRGDETAEQVGDGTRLPAGAQHAAPLPHRARHQPDEPEGDPVLRVLLHPVRRSGLRTPGAVVRDPRRDRAGLQRALICPC